MAGSICKRKTREGFALEVYTTSGGRYMVADVVKRNEARPFLAYGHDGRDWKKLGGFKLQREAEAAAMTHAESVANLIDVADAMRAARA